MIKINLDFTQQYKHILLSGNSGDPIYHSQFHEVLEFLQEVAPQTPIIIATNGSHRNIDWWKKTAHLLLAKDLITFAIDGLEDSNSIYRKNADWPTIIKGIQTLKEYSGCIVQWQWILFKQNQHLVKQGAAQAKSLGVDRFFILKSSRDNGWMDTTMTLEEALL
jgi:sulfatase maturation enzyme AslB (radical SAM superfamily)